MKKIKGRAKYIGLTMPAELMEEVGEIVNKKGSSYRSKNEFVKWAIREQIAKERNIERLRSEGKIVYKAGLPSERHQSNLDKEEVDNILTATQMVVDNKMKKLEEGILGRLDKIEKQLEKKEKKAEINGNGHGLV